MSGECGMVVEVSFCSPGTECFGAGHEDGSQLVYRLDQVDRERVRLSSTACHCQVVFIAVSNACSE